MMETVAFLEKVHEITDFSNFSERERLAINKIKESGFEGVDSELVNSLRSQMVITPPKQLHVFDPQNIVFPLKVAPYQIINAMGTCVWNRPGFHCERYLYPTGYECERLVPSIFHMDDRMWLKGSILDTGEADPLFRVEIPGDSKYVWTGSSPSRAWLEAMKTVAKIRSKQGGSAPRIVSVSGPEYFGFTSPFVLYLFSQMKGHEKCKKFRAREIDPRELVFDFDEEEEKMEAPPPPKTATKTSFEKRPSRPPSKQSTRRPNNAPPIRPKSAPVPLQSKSKSIVKRIAMPPVRELTFNFGEAWKNVKDDEIPAVVENEDEKVYGFNGRWLMARFRAEHCLPIAHQNPLQYMLDFMKRQLEGDELFFT
jgi:hypothetical protein